MVVQQARRFKHRISQVHWRRMLYLSLPIDSVGDCIRYANIKVFSEPSFPVYGQNPGTSTGKYISGKTCIFPFFYPVRRISLISPENYTSLNKKNIHHTENK